MAERRRGGGASPAPAGWSPRWSGLLVFVFALLLRLAFWQATPDAVWPASATYQGDAYTWMSYGQSLLGGPAFEGGLPWRPPGMAWLVALLGGGTAEQVGWLKFVWCLLGAATCWLVWWAVRRDFGEAAGLAAGLGCGAATGLLVLSTSLNNETPWLLLCLLGVAWTEPLRQRPRRALGLAWGAVQAAACLLRAEQILVTLALGAWIALRPGKGGRNVARLPALGAAAGAFLLVLLPWHLHAWRAAADFNDQPSDFTPAVEQHYQRLEAVLAHVAWDPEARQLVERLPRYSQRSARMFIAGTVAYRGGDRVTAADVGVLREAFGVSPAPLPRRFFIAPYGGLNFYLANNEEAVIGFARGPLDAPPPLAATPALYPPLLVAGLPPADLSFLYPPHSDAVAHGYRYGLRWLLAHPGTALARAAGRLHRFALGAATTWTGHGLPIGRDGLRPNVDLVIPTGWRAWLWPALVFAACAAGLAGSGRTAALAPWLLLAAARAATAVVFFGYARIGATVIPVVVLLLALLGVRLAGRWEPPAFLRGRRGAARAVGLLLVLVLALEGLRWGFPPQLRLDGQPVGSTDPTFEVYRDVRFSTGSPATGTPAPRTEGRE